MKFKLIALPSAPGDRIFIPYGMGIVYAFLKNRQNVEQIDLNMKIKRLNQRNIDSRYNLTELYDYDRIHRFIRGAKDIDLKKKIIRLISICNIDKNDIVCFSIHSYHQLIAALLMSLVIKAKMSNKIVFGGAYFSSADYEFLFNEYPFIDIITVGSIDRIYHQLLSALTKDRCIVKSSQSPKFILPDYTGIHLKHYSQNIDGKIRLILPIQTSQGCPGRCSFCNYDKNISCYKSHEIVHAIRYFKKKYKTNFFYLINLNLDPNDAHVKEICSSLKPERVYWESKCRAVGLDPETLKLMSDSGCFRLEIGLESASQRVLDKMNKHINIKKLQKNIKFARKTGIKIMLNIIVGFPSEDDSDFKKTLRFMNDNARYVDWYHISRFIVSSGSDIAKNPLKYGVIIKDQDFFDRIKGRHKFEYLQCINAEKREKMALKLSFKKVLRKRYMLLNFIPFSVFYHLYYQRALFSSNTMNFSFNLFKPVLNR